jgi:hypothetical protein
MKEYTNERGQHVGTLTDGIYRSKRHGKKHKMRIFGGAWGIDMAIYYDLFDKCSEVRILDLDDNTIYSASMNVLSDKGIIRDLAHGQQIFLPIKNWNITEKS